MIVKPMSRVAAATLISLTFSGAALAVQPSGYTTESGVVITPLLNTGLKYDDNIFSQSSNEEGSAIVVIAPSANFLLDDGINQYMFDVGIESGTYLSSSDDNYLSSNLGASTHLEPSSSSRIDASITAFWGVEPRGTGVTEGAGDVVNEPLTYGEQTVAGTYEYGVMSSSMRVAFDAAYYNKNYSNFAALTDTLNYDSVFVGATAFYTTNSGTDAFFELNRKAISYDEVGTTSLDSSDYRALIGATWEATALTSGTAKIGYQRKSFSSDERERFSGLSWDVSVTWQPLTYSTVILSTSRSARDPNVAGDYISESLYGASWIHQWSDMVSTGVGVDLTDENYGGITRQDDTTSVNANIDFALRRWLDASFYVVYTDKESTDPTILFDKSIVGVNFTISL